MTNRILLFFFLVLPFFCLAQSPLNPDFDFTPPGRIMFDKGVFEAPTSVDSRNIETVLLSLKDYRWDEDNSTWDNISSNTYENDSCLNWIIWYSSFNFLGTILTDTLRFSFNNTPNQNVTIQQELNSMGGWLNQIKYIERFDNNDQPLSATISLWVDNQWEQGDSIHITRTVNGNEETEEWLRYSLNGNIIGYRAISTKDPNSGLVVEYEEQQFSNGIWENDLFISNQYNSNDLLTESILQEWDGSQFMFEEKNDFTYNGLGQLSTQIESDWFSTDWIPDRKDYFIYDFNSGLVDSTVAYNYLFTIQFWHYSLSSKMEYNMEGDLTKQTNYNYSTDSWELRSKRENTYEEISCLLTHTENLIVLEDHFTIYPTVSDGKFLIIFNEHDFPSKEKQLRILSLNGKVLLNQTIEFNQKNVPISIPSFPSGMYLVQVTTESSIETESFIVR